MTDLGAFLLYAGIVVILAALWDRWRDRRDRKREIDLLFANFYKNRGKP